MDFSKLPSFENIKYFAKRFPDLDMSSVEATVALLRVTDEVNGAFDAHFGRLNLSRGRFLILIHLMRQEGRSALPAELAECCRVTRSTMTGLLDTLEAGGLIEREASTEDRRAVNIRITAKGIEHLETIMPLHYQRVSAFMQHLQKDERKEFVRLLSKVWQGIPALQNPESPSDDKTPSK